MYDLYIANKNYSSWSLRPWVLMRELAIPFREILVPFGGAQNPDAFRTFSPTGKVPCLVDGDTTVWDSLAITEYLGERHAGVWPAEAAARAWARSAADVTSALPRRLPGAATVHSSAIEPKPLRMKSRRDQASAGAWSGFIA